MARAWKIGLILSCFSFAACGSGGGSPGTQDQSIVPCNQGQPAFDVWRAEFNPLGRQTITATVDTRDRSTASETRLVVACQGEVLIDTIGGRVCSKQPPSKPGDPIPECPLASIRVSDIDFSNRIECLAEVTTTEPLDIGVGVCADPAVADYEIRLTIDGQGLALDLEADNCRADESCLEEMFGIEP